MNHWIEISEAALAANYHALAAAAGEQIAVLAVVKANGYGHGAERCAVALARAGAPWLGVTDAAEGARVRAALGAAAVTPSPDILVMCGFVPEDVPLLAAHGLVPVLWTVEQAGWLAGTGLRVQVEVDTGMARQGVVPGPALPRLLNAVKAAGLVLDGVFTHFAGSEVVGSAKTAGQQRRFAAAVDQVAGWLEAHPAGEAATLPLWLHAGNTSTLDNPLDPGWLPGLAARLAPFRPVRLLVRSGLALYGYCLPLADGAQAGPPPRGALQPALQPVLRWQARVLAVRALAAGEEVGYSSAFAAPEHMRVALVGVGYADGLRRELGSSTGRAGGWMMVVAGRRGPVRAPILGRVSMNLAVLDVSAAPGVEAGDLVTVLGPGITADDHARLAGTIAYEILCNLKAPRRGV